MKKRVLIIFVTMLLTLAAVLFVACDGNEDKTENISQKAEYIQFKSEAVAATYEIGLCEDFSSKYIRIPLIFQPEYGISSSGWMVDSVNGEKTTNLELNVPYVGCSGLNRGSNADSSKLSDFTLIEFILEVKLTNFVPFEDKKIDTITFKIEDKSFDVNVDITIYDATQNGIYRDLEMLYVTPEARNIGEVVTSFDLDFHPILGTYITSNADATITKVEMRNRNGLNNLTIAYDWDNEDREFENEETFADNSKIGLIRRTNTVFSINIDDVEDRPSQFYGYEMIIHYTLKSDGCDYFMTRATTYANYRHLMAWVENEENANN